MDKFNYVKGFNLFGVKARQIPCLTGKGEPSNELALKIGLLYIDEDSGDMYKCIKINGEEGLVWVLVNNKDTSTDSGQNVELDTTLTQSGKAADAKAVGDALDKLEEKIPSIEGLAKEEDIPMKTSELTNDSGYQTAAQVTAIVQRQLGVIENGTY